MCVCVCVFEVTLLAFQNAVKVKRAFCKLIFRTLNSLLKSFVLFFFFFFVSLWEQQIYKNSHGDVMYIIRISSSCQQHTKNSIQAHAHTPSQHTRLMIPLKVYFLILQLNQVDIAKAA